VKNVEEKNWWHISDVKTTLHLLYVHLFLVKIFQGKCETGELRLAKREELDTASELKESNNSFFLLTPKPICTNVKVLSL
jgi:hypothetical protein